MADEKSLEELEQQLAAEVEALEKKKQALQKRIEEQKRLEEQKKKEAQEDKEAEEEDEFFVAEDKDIFRLIMKTLGLLDRKIIAHSSKVAYIVAKVLESKKAYTKKQIAQYAVIAMLCDLGEFKIQNDSRSKTQEMNNAWAHSIYSYLYIRNFSPLGELGNIVLYHHVDFKKFDSIMTEQKFEAAVLALADRIERMLGDYDAGDSLKGLFAKLSSNKTSSDVVQEALPFVINAIREFNISTKLVNGEWEAELYEVLENLKLDEEEKRKYLELLMYAFDFQTDEAFLDTLRTVSISEQIGKVMLVSEYERKVLYYGTLLYDIGKFALPMDILRKPGKLTRAEMDIVRSHVSYTEYLLEDYFPQAIINVASRHHERLDGSGYPMGLTGEDLSLADRILAVADIVSALSADRSYRKALPKVKILEILQSDMENGKLCPYTVKAMFKRYDVIMNGAAQQVKQATKEFVVENAVSFRKLYNGLHQF